MKSEYLADIAREDRATALIRQMLEALNHHHTCSNCKCECIDWIEPIIAAESFLKEEPSAT